MPESIVESLLASTEPAIRWKVRARVLGEPAGSGPMVALRDQIRDSAVVRRLLAPFDMPEQPSVYAKWQGAHWVLAALADLGYPPGDASLSPLREQVVRTWLDPAFSQSVEIATKSEVYRHAGVPLMQGRHRAHASQQGNAMWFLLTLGLADDRCDQLAELLLRWQWPDGDGTATVIPRPTRRRSVRRCRRCAACGRTARHRPGPLPGARPRCSSGAGWPTG